MTSTTPNYSLPIYASGDTSEFFLNFRLDLAGSASTSAMNVIDTVLNDHDTSITALEARKNIIAVPATFISGNDYEATVSAITAYETNQVIALKLDTDSTGSVILNINSLGAKNVMKVDSSGSYINLSGSDMRANREYNCKYDGTRWVWMDATSADQVNINGTSGNFIYINSDNEIEDSGSSSSTFAVAAKGVTNGDSHDHSGGDGAQIDHESLSNIGTLTHAQIETELDGMPDSIISQALAEAGTDTDAYWWSAERVSQAITALETGGGDAADVTYTPADNSNWSGNTDPGNVNDALDELADRALDTVIDVTVSDMACPSGAETLLCNLNNELPENGTYAIDFYFASGKTGLTVGSGTGVYWELRMSGVIAVSSKSSIFNPAPSATLPLSAAYHHRTIALPDIVLNSNENDGSYGDLCLYIVPPQDININGITLAFRRLI